MFEGSSASVQSKPSNPTHSNISNESTESNNKMNEIETFYGKVDSTTDALRIFELCRQGKLGRVRRRLHERERKMIRSGSVFVFDELESGIKRWTDGRLWSPSRILGNFLIYRELDRKIPAKLMALGGVGSSSPSKASLHQTMSAESSATGSPGNATGIEAFNQWWSSGRETFDFTAPVIPTDAISLDLSPYPTPRRLAGLQANDFPACHQCQGSVHFRPQRSHQKDHQCHDRRPPTPPDSLLQCSRFLHASAAKV